MMNNIMKKGAFHYNTDVSTDSAAQLNGHIVERPCVSFFRVPPGAFDMVQIKWDWNNVALRMTILVGSMLSPLTLLVFKGYQCPNGALFPCYLSTTIYYYSRHIELVIFITPKQPKLFITAHYT